jgi:hypothetical protein
MRSTIISGPSDGERHWPLFHRILDPKCSFFAAFATAEGETLTGQWTADEFQRQHRDEYADRGYWRRCAGYQEFLFGDIAHVLSACELRVGSRETPPVLRGIDSVQLTMGERGWHILCVAFQAELPDLLIPPVFLDHP